MLRRAEIEELSAVNEANAVTAKVQNVGLPAIFAAFFWLGLSSFGGGTAGWLHREIVLRRHWIDDATFLSAVALGRFMPGSGGVNLTVQVGQRLRGPMGAAAAVTGLLSGPLVVVLALAEGWEKVRGVEVLHAVLDGVGAAAIGLTFATGLSLTPRGSTAIGPLAVTLATVVAVGVLRWPMIPVVLGLLPVSIGLAALREKGGWRA
jgi:chromate transporter